MDRLFTPWRYRYVSTVDTRDEAGCLFCRLRDEAGEDAAHHVLYRGRSCYVVLNKYPYTAGHLLVVPGTHWSRLDEAAEEVLEEMMRLARRCERALSRAFRPSGFNVGMNLGRAGGAGIPAHLHLHLVPRWEGDTNFMTVTGGTRVIPQDLDAVDLALRPLLHEDEEPR